MIRSAAQLDFSAGASARDALELRGVFADVDPSSCPRRYNFHMHTNHSDGQLSPEVLVEQAIQLGLKEFAITDHHTVSGYRHAKQCLEDWQWRHPAPIHISRRQQKSVYLPRLWIGIEVTTLLMEVEVHILGYAFNPTHPAMQPYLSGHAPRGTDQLAHKVIPAIQAAGGMAILAHPCRYRQSADVLVPAAVECGIDGIETYYAYDNPKEWRPCPKKTPAMEHLAAELDILSTCGTDTHGTRITRRI